jgi:hypothetical protein
VPYGKVSVDDGPARDSPVELRLPSGTHRVRVTDSPNPRPVERNVVVRAGVHETATIPVLR